MLGNKLSTRLWAAMAILAVVLFSTSSWAASHQILHSFNPNGADGAEPYGGLIADSAGNRYGTTYYGGTDNVGAVFELSPNGSSGWTEKVIYSFSSNGNHGTYLEGGLVLDGAGNLYGTTTQGGIHGGGTMFELSPNGSGGWTETVLHSFGGGTDGGLPYAGLIFDGAGNLYGTTEAGGIYGGGTVFEFSPRQGGGWTETVLHNFNPATTDGSGPQASLIRDAAGNLYGTTTSGGIHFWGNCDSSCPPGKAEAGRRKFCTALTTTARMGFSPRPDWSSTVPAISMAQPIRAVFTTTFRLGLRDAIRVVAQRKRRLDGDGAAQFWQWHGRGRSLCQPDLRWCRQSLWHHFRWRHSHLRSGIRVVTSSRRRLDGDGPA